MPTSAAEGLNTRAMTTEDIVAAVGIFASTSYRDVPDGALVRLAETLKHFLGTDGDGCWLATAGERPVGFAVATRRDDLWVLPALYVAPDHQAAGAGRRLLELALGYAANARRAIITSSGDPRATRLYGSAGFTAHPTLYAVGRADATAAPSRLKARDASVDDLDLMIDVDSSVRDATRRVDLELLLLQGVSGLVAETRTGRGYALYRDGEPPVDGVPMLLTATDVATARALLWQVLRDSDAAVHLDGLTPSREWAVDIAITARLQLRPGGALFTRGFSGLPAPWLSSGFLA
jgi:GNAT superfamily N-acetyltransferase